MELNESFRSVCDGSRDSDVSGDALALCDDDMDDVDWLAAFANGAATTAWRDWNG